MLEAVVWVCVYACSSSALRELKLVLMLCDHCLQIQTAASRSGDRLCRGMDSGAADRTGDDARRAEQGASGSGG